MESEVSTIRRSAIASPQDISETGERDPATSPIMRGLSFAARLFLGSVFLISGAEKLGALKTFGHAIANYEILPEPLSNIAALLFVWAEIVVGILMIAGIAIRGSALVTSGMLVVFLIAIVSAIARGLDIDCGCFAGDPEPVGWKKVAEDVGLLAVAVFLIYFPKSYLTMEKLFRQET